VRPLKTEVRQQFILYNTAFFGGALPNIPIHFRKLKNADAHYWDPYPGKPNGLIVIDPASDFPCGWRGLLLHELLHAWLETWRVDEFDTGDVQDHGPVFTAEANRIGRLLGLPDVDESESWCWPGAAFEGVVEPVGEPG